MNKHTAASRRDFLKVIAAGTAAAMVGPTAGIAEQTKGVTTAGHKREARAAVNLRSGELEKGIEEQKAYLRETVQTIRDYELETNSELAVSFAPLRAPGRGSR